MFFTPPLGGIFWHGHVFTSQVSHHLHHAFHFCFIRALTQWRRSACGNNRGFCFSCDLSRGRSGRKRPSSTRSLCEIRFRRGTLLLRFQETELLPVLDCLCSGCNVCRAASRYLYCLPSQPSPFICSPSLMGEAFKKRCNSGQNRPRVRTTPKLTTSYCRRTRQICKVRKLAAQCHKLHS